MSRLSDPFDTGTRPDQIEVARPVPVETPWGQFALYRLDDGGIRAWAAFCPHLLGPLFEGSISNDQVRCPWHDWRFRLDDGVCVHAALDDGVGTRLSGLDAEIGSGGTIVLSPPPAA